jgi:hypothetical protein
VITKIAIRLPIGSSSKRVPGESFYCCGVF